MLNEGNVSRRNGTIMHLMNQNGVPVYFTNPEHTQCLVTSWHRHKLFWCMYCIYKFM